jgi:ribose-phosphate pyrophosphokinase
MISTGGTLISAMEALLEKGCRPSFALAASHALLVDEAAERLSEMPLKRLVTTDSVAGSASSELPVRRVRLDRLLANTIRRLHCR